MHRNPSPLSGVSNDLLGIAIAATVIYFLFKKSVTDVSSALPTSEQLLESSKVLTVGNIASAARNFFDGQRVTEMYHEPDYFKQLAHNELVKKVGAVRALEIEKANALKQGLILLEYYG